jgi:Tfp pilus assembly protein PilX
MIARRRQQGATLLVALIILVLLALMSLSAFHTGSTDLKASGNMQARTEALNAAQEAIETVISTSQFVSDPANAISTPCAGTANTYCSDYNGDGAPEYTTRLTPAPACVAVKVIKVPELDLTSQADLGCVVGQSQQFGVAGAASNDSLCANTVWQITAESSSNTNGAKVTVTQGVGIRVSTDDMAASCS